MNAYSAAGAPDTSKKGRKSGIEALELAIAGEQVSRMNRSLHYDELQRFSSVGASFAGTKPVRDDDGKIDILATFERAGVSIEDKTIQQAEEIKGGWF
jgi:hypothetical protein